MNRLNQIIGYTCIFALCMILTTNQDALAEASNGDANVAVKYAQECDANKGTVACVIYEGEFKNTSEIPDTFQGVLACVKSNLGSSNERRASRDGYSAITRAKACSRNIQKEVRYGNFTHHDLSALDGTCVQVGEQGGLHNCSPNSNAFDDSYRSVAYMTGAVELRLFSPAAGIANSKGPIKNLWITGKCCETSTTRSYMSGYHLPGLPDNMKIIDRNVEFATVEGTDDLVPVGVNLRIQKRDENGVPQNFSQKNRDQVLQLICTQLSKDEIER